MNTRSKIALWLATGLILLLFGCRAGGPGLLNQPGPGTATEDPNHIELPLAEEGPPISNPPVFDMNYSGPYSEARFTTDSTINIAGSDFVEESGSVGNAVDPMNPDAYFLRTETGTSSSWSRYVITGLDAERPVSMDCSFLAAPILPGGDDDLPLSCWVGLGNFTSGMWEWFGPFSESQLIVLNSETSTDRYISSTGDMHFAVVTDATLVDPSAKNLQGLSGVSVVTFTVDTLGPESEEYEETKPEVPDLGSGSTGKSGSGLDREVSALIPGTYVKLTWNHKRDTIAPRMEAIGYRVYRMRINPREPLMAIGGTIWPNTTHIDPIDNKNVEPPVPGGTYAYFLRAYNAAGWTRLSKPLIVNIPDSMPYGLELSALAETYYGGGDAAGFYLEYTDTDTELFVTIHARRMMDLRAFFFSLQFDSKQVNPVQMVPGLALNPKVSTDMIVDNGMLYHGQIQVRPQDSTGELGDGVLAVISFEKMAQPFVNTVSAQPPVNEQSRSVLTYLTDSDSLHWYYANAGDYDQNGQVALADLVPAAEYFGAASLAGPFPYDSIQSVVDGNQDHEVSEADVSVMQFGLDRNNTVTEYRVYGSFNWELDYPWSPSADNGNAILLAVIPFESAMGASTSERLHLVHELDLPDPGMTYWVRPAVSDGVNAIEGIASNRASLP